MDLVHRHSLVPGVAAAVIAAYLGARTVNLFVASAIAAAPAIPLTSEHLPPPVPAIPIDAELMAKLFDVPLPAVKGDLHAQPRPIWTSVPARTSLRGTLAGTAVADPEAYSVCEIIDPE